MAKDLAKDPADRYPNCSAFATALTGRPGVGAADTIAGNAAADTVAVAVAPPAQSAPQKPRASPPAGGAAIGCRGAGAARAGRRRATRCATRPMSRPAAGAAADANTNQPQSGSGSAADAVDSTHPVHHRSRREADRRGPQRRAGERPVKAVHPAQRPSLGRLCRRLLRAHTAAMGRQHHARQRVHRYRWPLGRQHRQPHLRFPATGGDDYSATGPRVNTDLIRKDRIAPAVQHCTNGPARQSAPPMGWRPQVRSSGQRRCEQFHHRRRGDRRTVEDALGDFTSTVAQPFRYVSVLDAFGDRRHIQGMRQVDDGPHDGFGARIGQHVSDQVVVDLNFVDGRLRRYVNAE